MEQIKSLTIDGVAYSVDQFSPQLKQTVAFYERLLSEGEALNAEVQELQFKIDTNRAATMFMHNQLSSQAKLELEMLRESLNKQANTDSDDQNT